MINLNANETLAVCCTLINDHRFNVRVAAFTRVGREYSIKTFASFMVFNEVCLYVYIYLSDVQVRARSRASTAPVKRNAVSAMKTGKVAPAMSASAIHAVRHTAPAQTAPVSVSPGGTDVTARSVILTQRSILFLRKVDIIYSCKFLFCF